MFLIAPKSESEGVSLSVEEAKKLRAKHEELFRLKPDLRHGNMLACIWHTVGETGKAIELMDYLMSNPVFEQLDNVGKSIYYLNRGQFARAFGDFATSYKCTMKGWSLDKTSAFLAMAVAEEHFRCGEWAEGWPLHNSSRGTCEGSKFALGLGMDCKFWDGKEIPDHLLVINEGGAGDRINYTRWLPELTRRGIDWSFFCFDELKPFYDRLSWIGPERTIGESEKKEFSPPPSHWTTTFSLAGPLGISPATIPDYPEYFTAPKSNLSISDPLGRPIVGICWNANELYQGGLKVRSLTEGQAMRLVCLTEDKICWVNVQHSHKMPHPVLNVPFSSWEDTAVLLDRLDALVTVDCGTLWLSLAMGKRTACLLTAPEDWKFTSEWGPHLKKFHNGPSELPMDAEKAIDKLIMAIRNDEWPKKFEAATVPSICNTTNRLHMVSQEA